MIKRIIFDMDGTLCDTAKATLAAVKTVEKRFKLPPITYEHIKKSMGIAGLEFYRSMFPGLPEDVLVSLEPVVDALEQDIIQSMGADILFPGVYELLEALWQAGYELHIASTGSKVHVYGTLDATGIESFFTGISCGEPAKISMVRHIIADSDPKEWAMVGDMYKDSEAAKGNNIMALGAGFGYLAEQDFLLFDAVLDTPKDLWDFI